MTRYGASTREYSRTDDDADTHHPIRTSDRASARIDSTYERTTFHSGRGGTATSDDDESEYGGYRQHHRGVARGGTHRRRHRRDEDPVIEQLRREVREDEARRRVDGEDYSYDDDDDEDDAFALPRRMVMSRGVARATGGVRAGTGDGNGNGNRGTTPRRHRREEDPVIERLRREVREEEARLTGCRGACSDDSEGETGFGREVGAGNGVRRPHFYDSEDDGMEGGCRGAFCGGWRSRV